MSKFTLKTHVHKTKIEDSKIGLSGAVYLRFTTAIILAGFGYNTETFPLSTAMFVRYVQRLCSRECYIRLHGGKTLPNTTEVNDILGISLRSYCTLVRDKISDQYRDEIIRAPRVHLPCNSLDALVKR